MVLKEVPFFGEYTLRYDWDAYEKICEELNIETFTQFNNALNMMGPKKLRIMLWAGLLHKFPDLKPEEVSKIIDEYKENNPVGGIPEAVLKGLREAQIIGEIKGVDTGESPTKPRKN